MELKIVQNGDIARFIISGDIDETGSNEMKNGFKALNLSVVKVVSFDFAQVTRIGSAGLGKMLLFYKQLATSGAELRIENASNAIRDLMKELNLDTLFVIS